MTLNTKIGYALLFSVLSLFIAGLAPSRYTLTLSAIITTAAIIYVAYSILADEE